MKLLLALTKPRLTLLSIASAMAGYALGHPNGSPWTGFWWTLLGVSLIGGGANAFNMLLERQWDALMQRTSQRPLPTGSLTPSTVLAFALFLAGSGLYVLAMEVNPLAGWLGLATLVTYVLIYTPLKRVTVFNTMFGAIPGALPPLIGYAASAGALGPLAWILAAILFLWQIPHFLAISWLYREDYRRAGFAMLSVVDDERGRMTGRQIILSTAALLPVSIYPTVAGHASVVYFVMALVLGLGFILVSLTVLKGCQDASARTVFRYSIFHLTLIMAALVTDRTLFYV